MLGIIYAVKIHTHQNDYNNLKKKKDKYLQGCEEIATLMHCGRNIFKQYSHSGKEFGNFLEK